MLTLIVAPQPLAEFPVRSEPVKISNEKLAQWEKQWGGQAEQFELEGGAGRPYTMAEKATGADGSRKLTQADPLPQTLLRLNAKPGSPLLVKVLLRIAQ